MFAVRRALAVLPVAAVAIAAPSAQAAAVQTLPCANYIEEGPAASPRVLATMPIVASGFAPGSSLTVWATTPSNPTPLPLASGQTDALGVFKVLVAPPAFAKRGLNTQSFTLMASDPANPVTAAVPMPFKLVRFGMTRRPNPKRPRQAVTYTARGFTPGKAVYAHFRYGGVTRRTVTLGVAKGVCGITRKRMRALPTKVRYGSWGAYIDQSPRFSVKTRPQWIDPFEIKRVLR